MLPLPCHPSASSAVEAQSSDLINSRSRSTSSSRPFTPSSLAAVGTGPRRVSTILRENRELVETLATLLVEKKVIDSKTLSSLVSAKGSS